MLIHCHVKMSTLISSLFMTTVRVCSAETHQSKQKQGRRNEEQFGCNISFCVSLFQDSQKGPGTRQRHRLYPEFNGRHQCEILPATGGGQHLRPQEPGSETVPGWTLAAPQAYTACVCAVICSFIYPFSPKICICVVICLIYV